MDQLRPPTCWLPFLCHIESGSFLPSPGDSHGYPKIALENRLPMEHQYLLLGSDFKPSPWHFRNVNLRPNLRPHWPSHSHRGYTHLSLAEGWGRAAARLVCPWVTLLAGWYRKCEEGAALRFGLKTTRSSSKILKWPRIGGENLRLTLETPVIGGKNHCFNRIQPFFPFNKSIEFSCWFLTFHFLQSIKDFAHAKMCSAHFIGKQSETIPLAPRGFNLIEVLSKMAERNDRKALNKTGVSRSLGSIVSLGI